jgi:hypothetical protein
VSFIFAGLFSLFLSKKRKMKGQAAVEFLMTYGWAILAAVIAIGVLSYFGAFSPGKYVSSRVLLSPPFYSTAHSISEEGVLIEVKNPGSLDYTILTVKIDVPGFATCSSSSPPVTIKSGERSVFFIPCLLGSPGKKVSGDILVEYNKIGSLVTATSRGTFSGVILSTVYSSLTIFINGGGGESVQCEGYGCDGVYGSGTVISLVNGIPITLTAIPGSITSWTGACAGQGPVCNIFMDGDKTVTANY